MNLLFKSPLHGVFSVPFCGIEKHNLPLEITLDFSRCTLDEKLKPIWTMVDQGDRYHSEVCLYKAAINEHEKRLDNTDVDSNFSDSKKFSQ